MTTLETFNILVCHCTMYVVPGSQMGTSHMSVLSQQLTFQKYLENSTLPYQREVYTRNMFLKLESLTRLIRKSQKQIS